MRKLFLSGTLLMGCATAQPLLITGESLDGAAISFEATAAGMAAVNPSLTPSQRAAWNAFVPKFKASFHAARALWESARASANQPVQDQAAAILSTMLIQLQEFTVMVFITSPDGGS